MPRLYGDYLASLKKRGRPLSHLTQWKSWRELLPRIIVLGPRPSIVMTTLPSSSECARTGLDRYMPYLRPTTFLYAWGLTGSGVSLRLGFPINTDLRQMATWKWQQPARISWCAAATNVLFPEPRRDPGAAQTAFF